MNCDLFFPVPVWHDMLQINNEPLLDFCKEKKSLSNGRVKSNINGWQSEDFWPEDDVRIHELCKEIYIRSLTIISEYKYEISNLKFLNLWANINYKNSSNRVHMHHNSILSGVYYLRCSKNCGDIVFPRNYSESYIIESIGNISERNLFNYNSISYTPEVGKLIIFPGWIPHEVDKNESDQERISISFNLGV